MKVALIFAVVAVAANVLLIWYVKKTYRKAKADKSSDLNNTAGVFSHGYLNTPEVKRLRQAVAVELGISVEELDRMSVEDVRQLAKQQELINTG